MKKILILLLVLPLLTLAQTNNKNYIKNTIYKVPSNGTAMPYEIPVILEDEDLPTPPPAIPVLETDKITTINYIDGLGRPFQKIQHIQSNSGKDIITHSEYNFLGVQTKEYLPYVSQTTPSLNYIFSAKTNQQNYYANTNPTVTGNPAFETTAFPFSEKLLEKGPELRVIKQSAPGEAWNMGSGKEIKMEYKTNAANEVKFYEVTTALISNYYNTGSIYYKPGELYKTITKNENWIPTDITNNTTEEFKDRQGRVVLKRTFNSATYDTYYCYDEFGNLTYVIPPIVNNGVAITQTILDDLCYQYKYDSRNRLVEKKLPGKQWEFIVYDRLDRVIATGPAFDPYGTGDTGWLITKYDVFDRIVYTGFQFTSVALSSQIRATLQGLQDQTTSSSINEEKITSPITIDGISVGYTNDVSINTNGSFILLTVNYYDDYNFPDAPSVPTTLATSTLPLAQNLKGLATGSLVRVLDAPGSSSAEKTYMFYDKKYRVVQSHKTNYLGGYTEVNTNLDWQGKTLYTLTKQKRTNADTELLIKDTFTYSLQDRLLMQTQQINALPEQLIVKNTYDELGQLISKNVGGTDTTGSAGLQKIDYRYNIRGWLTGINDINNLATENDLFAFKINYNTFEQTGSSDVSPNLLYNGNISSTYWKTSTDNMIRKYNYTYDKLNRLVDATYLKPELNTSVNSYAENVSYDKNGNIQYLNRNGDLDSAVDLIEIDNLTYTYDTNKKNQLLRVTDSSNHPAGFDDSNNPGSGQDYYYDDNGNLISDANKTIQHITYNHLNLPVEILFTNNVRSIRYTYNAIGAKVKKHVVTDAPIRGNPNYGSTVTDYLDGFQYKNSILKLFPHAEGYVDAVASLFFQGYHFNYIFNYVDHLGNVRASYAGDFDTDGPNSAIIMEESHYYPFGLKHTKYNTNTYQYVNTLVNSYVTGIELMPPGVTPDYKYKYNGKEFQDELGLNMYDYGARNYDPAIGRWMNIDNLSEKHFNFSPYTYTANNPVLFVDIDGNDYGVTINRMNKTINISAVYISNSKDSNLLKKGLNTYNSLSGKRLFIVGGVKELKRSKGKSDAYTINYNLETQIDNTKSVEGFSGGKSRVLDDQTGTLNSFETSDNFRKDSQKGTTGNDKIAVREDANYGDVSHEVGHSLGNAHTPDGGSLPLTAPDTSEGSTAETLAGVGIGGNNSQRNENSSVGDGTLLNQSSSAGLENGQVISQRRYNRLMKKINKDEENNK